MSHQKRLACYKDILATEQSIQDETYKTFGKWFVKFADAMDILLELSYLERNLPSDILSSDYAFYCASTYSYYEIPLTFRSCSALLEEGLYNDSLIIVRSILENLVKYKYFLDHKDQFEIYENGKTHIQILAMWDYVAGNGAYQKIYKHLCQFTHKNMASILYCVNSRQSSNVHLLVPSFDHKLAGAIINYLIYTIYGYLNLAPRLTSYIFESADPNFLQKYADIKNWLEDQIQKHPDQFPKVTEWHKIMKKITAV